MLAEENVAGSSVWGRVVASGGSFGGGTGKEVEELAGTVGDGGRGWWCVEMYRMAQ